MSCGRAEAGQVLEVLEEVARECLAWLLPFAASVFFVEVASSLLPGLRAQQAPWQARLRMRGWSERKVLLALWSASLAACALGLLLWHGGILPGLP